MIVWATRDIILKEIASVSDGWLDHFMVAHANDCRKFGDSRQSSMLFRTQAVLDAIEAGERITPVCLSDKETESEAPHHA